MYKAQLTPEGAGWLVKIVLQNRQNLHLLAAQQGGTGFSLEEEWCYYAKKSGVVTKNSYQSWKWLEQRAKNIMGASSWWESLDFLPSWMKAILGPIMVIVTFLPRGPCVIPIITHFLTNVVRSYPPALFKIQLFLKAAPFYQLLNTEETEEKKSSP